MHHKFPHISRSLRVFISFSLLLQFVLKNVKCISSNIARLAKSFLFLCQLTRGHDRPLYKRRPYGVIFPPSPFLLCLPSLPSAQLSELMTKHTQQLRVTRRPVGLSVLLGSALSSPPFSLSLSSLPCRLKAPS